MRNCVRCLAADVCIFWTATHGCVYWRDLWLQWHPPPGLSVGVLSNLPSFLFKDAGSVLKRCGKVSQRYDIVELLRLAKFTADSVNEGTTPIERGLHGGLLDRI